MAPARSWGALLSLQASRRRILRKDKAPSWLWGLFLILERQSRARRAGKGLQNRRERAAKPQEEIQDEDGEARKGVEELELELCSSEGRQHSQPPQNP